MFCMEEKARGISRVMTVARHMSSSDHVWRLSEEAVSSLITSLSWSPYQLGVDVETIQTEFSLS